MNAVVQLAFDQEGLDPTELARLDIRAQAHLYDELDLDGAQRECVEAAVRAIKRGEYLRRSAR